MRFGKVCPSALQQSAPFARPVEGQLWDTRGVGAPSGTVTFLFTDVEGSTRLWESAASAMGTAIERHDELLRSAVEGHGGYVFSTGGDGFAVAFARARDAVAAAVDAQSALAAEPWPEEAVILVRMGLHTGEVEERGGDYFGTAVNQAARLMGLAHGGQVVCSAVTAGLVSDTLPPEVKLIDLGDHLLRDLSRRERVFQVEAPGLGAEFPPLRSPDVLPGNLPVQPTSFVGRTDEVRDLSEALGRAHLVTVTGVGGVGKTRLAVQVAADLLPAFADGAWLCELAAAGDADTLAQVVASTLGVAQRAGRSLERSIVEFLRPSSLLLVLDNCEHLLDASGRLAAGILADCPEVRVLATSREALAVPGEQVWPLRSLDLPGPGSGLEAVTASASVRLFFERAASARPGFALSETNVAAVVEICQRLDGIPLAIELAAARVAAMTPAEIAGLLGERFRLLTGGRRTVVERHQTLRAVVDWSYGLLSETERVVFDRLAVFSGGFTLTAARAVVTGNGVEAWDVVDAVAGLVAKSMVVAEPRWDEHTRYQLLETLRQYGRDRLDEHGDTDRWRRRHAQYFAAFAAKVGRGLRGRDELAWRERMMDDLDNLRSAVVWGLDTGIEEDQQTAVAIVAWLAYESATRSTGIGRWAEQAVRTVERSTPGYRNAVLGAAANAALSRGDLDASERYARAAVDEGYPLDDPSPCLASTVLAVLFVYQGRGDDAAPHVDAAEAAMIGRDDQDHSRSQLQSARVVITLFADDEDEEIAQARLAMSLAQRTGNPSLLALASFALGWALRHRHPDEAIAAFDEVLTRRAATTAYLSAALSYGARVAASLGDAEGAKTKLKEALEASIRDDDWANMTVGLDAAVDTFCYLDEARAAAVLTAAVETTLAPLRWPYVASRGPGLALRTANLAQVRETLGDSLYEQARTEGVAMSRQDALAFALRHL
jgi:predicted ATPase/class 3 adenylate cyclase